MWTSITEAEAWIEKNTGHPKSLMFSVCLKEQHPAQLVNVIGVVGLSHWDKAHYVFHPNFWGLGYCTEALSAFISILFEYQPDRMLLKAIVLEGNLASRRVLEKCKFTVDPPKNSLRIISKSLQRGEYSRPISFTEEIGKEQDSQSSTAQYEPDKTKQKIIYYTYRRTK